MKDEEEPSCLKNGVWERAAGTVDEKGRPKEEKGDRGWLEQSEGGPCRREGGQEVTRNSAGHCGVGILL